MKLPRLMLRVVLMCGFAARTLAADSLSLSPQKQPDISLRNELQHAIDRGLAWLQTNQNSNGWWDPAQDPAVTGLVVMSFKGNPALKPGQPQPEWLDHAYAYILASAQPDGGIYRTNLGTYNTSICMMALLAAQKPEYEPVLLKARRFLVGQQNNSNPGDPSDGGFSYGDYRARADMGNTLFALEALHDTKHLIEDKSPAEPDLKWDAAIRFLQNCQNLPSHNPASWVSTDPKDLGGFVYYPSNSNAGSFTNADGKVALRSYGSVSYDGLLSYIYADMKHDDPRVAAVFKWLQDNYTTEENPAMGQAGVYYYYHTMAKALTVYDVSELQLADGRKVDWRRELALKLMNLQQSDGSWVNTNARWREKEPILVTAYSVLCMEIIYRGI